MFEQNFKSINYLNIYFILCIIAFFSLVSIYIYLTLNFGYQNSNFPSNLTNLTYLQTPNPFSNVLNILGVLIGSTLTGSITLALYINTLAKESDNEAKRIKEEKEKLLSTVRTLIANNSEKSKMILMALKDEVDNITSGYDYKMPLLDLFSFTNILLFDIHHFINEEGGEIIQIAMKIEYLDKALKYREQLILHAHEKDISPKIKEQDEYLIDQLDNVIKSIDAYENNFIFKNSSNDAQ